MVLDDRGSLHYDPRIAEAYSSYREPDVSFINLEGNRMHPYSEDEEERLLSDLEMPLTHTSALHDIYSAPTFYSGLTRPVSPPIDDSSVEGPGRSSRVDRRSLSFAEFLTSMEPAAPPPPPLRSTELTRRPTLHRRDLDFPGSRRNRSRNARSSTTGSSSQTTDSGNFWGDYERASTMPSPFSRRTMRQHSEEGMNSARNRPSNNRHRSLHSGGSSSGSTSLRRGGVQPPEVMAAQTNVDGPIAMETLHRRIDPPLANWDPRDEFLNSLPTPRSTSPDTVEDRR